MKIKTQALGLIGFTIILIFLESAGNNLAIISIFAFVQAIVYVIYSKIENSTDRFLSLSIYLGIFIFYFGQVIVYYFMPHSNKISFILFDGRISKEDLFNATKFSALCYSFIFLGVSLFSSNIQFESESTNDEIIIQSSLEQCRTIGIILFLLTIIPSLIYEFSIMRESFSLGYLAGRNVVSNTHGIVDDLTRTCRAGILLMMLGYKEKPKVSRIIMLVFCSFFVIKMVVYGERGFALINIVVYIWTYTSCVREKRIKFNIKVIAAVLLVVFLVGIVGENREDSITNLNINTFLNAFTNNLIIREIVEFGGTLLTVGHIFYYIPEYANFIYGKTFLYSLFGLLPNAGSFDIDKYGSVGLISLIRGRNSLGGSFVADTYYNFGYFGVLVCLLYGILVVRVLKKIQYSEDYVSKAIWILVYSSILWLIRGTFLNIPRELVFSIGPVIVLRLFFKVIHKRKFARWR